MKQSMHARRMARAHRRSKTQSKLNLVSLMDIFTILVFFLLVNSSDVEVLQTNKSIKLPVSLAEKIPQETVVVMVSKDDIVIGGRQVTSVAEVMKSDDEEIPALQKELQYLASRKPFTSPEEQQKGRDITIMGDAEIPYPLLKKIITTCAKNEFRNVSLAVTRIEKSPTEPEES